MIPLTRSILPFGIGLALAATAAAATISLQQSPTYTTGGVTIRNDSLDTNINSNVQIIVGNTSLIVLRGLFEFDLTAIETAAAGNAFTIDSVSLVLTTSTTSGSGNVAHDFTLYSLGTNSDFDEATVTWNNAPTVAGGTAGTTLSTASFIPSTASATRTFGSTTAFSTAISSALASDPANTVRFILKANEENGGYLVRFNTNENATADLRPTLVVNYTIVPEPSTGLAAAAGLGMLILRRRRRA